MSVFLENDFYSSVSKEVANVVNIAAKVACDNNIKIYLIGGIVRDLILSNKIKDIDIAVEYDAIEFGKMLKSNTACEIVSTQENLRTIKVRFQNGIDIDFASTRQEKYIKSGVLPTAYNFGCELKDDIKRRDFTINTLALRLTGASKFELVDYCSGYEDIKNKKIRVLHSKSFIDDPSRIIRALKFKERFDFDIEEKTYQLMCEYLDAVDKTIPLERIKNELKQYFSIEKEGLYSNLIEANAYKLICEKPIRYIDETYFKKIINLGLIDSENFWFLYIVLLIINTEVESSKLNLTAYEKKVVKEVKDLLLVSISEKDSNKYIYSLFSDVTDISIALYYLITGNSVVEKFLNVLKDIKVLITGKDLIELGFIPSSYFSEILEKVLLEKLNGRLKTKEEEINYVKKFIKKESR